MNLALIIFIGFFVTVIIGLLIYYVMLFLSKDDEEILKGAFCLNLMSQRCHNSAYGIEKNIKMGRGNRMIIDYVRLDSHPDVVGESHVERVIVGRDKRISITPGEWSGEKTIVIYLPPKLSDIPQGFKQSIIGKLMMGKLNDINLDVEEKELLEKQVDAQSKIAKKIKGMEMVQTFIGQVDELNKDVKKLVSEKEEKKNPFYNSSHNP